MTAVRWDENGFINEYGAIEGHQEIGLFVLNSDHVTEAKEILQNNPTDWFPVVFQEVPSKPIAVDSQQRHEINTPEHLREARRKWDTLRAEPADD
jgi:hypothetical protein